MTPYGGFFRDYKRHATQVFDRLHSEPLCPGMENLWPRRMVAEAVRSAGFPSRIASRLTRLPLNCLTLRWPNLQLLSSAI